MEAETCKRELVIQIPPDIVRKESESIAGQYARKAHVPGFRPGHVPRDLILRRYREAIREEVVQNLLPRFFKDAVKEQNLLVAGSPSFEDVKFEEASPLTSKAIFEVYPQFELSEYKELEVAEEPVTVTDEDVARVLEETRQAAANFEVVNDRPAEDGDILSAAYEGWDARSRKIRLVEVKEGVIRLGEENTLPEFKENLRGARAGDAREFDVRYPEDFPQKQLAGKTVSFRVEVLAVKRKVVPPLDDELAKTVSRFSTLEELRTSLREQLEKRRQKESEAATKKKLLGILMERAKFPVPETLIEERLDQRLRSMAGALVEEGVDLGNAQIDWPKWRKDLRPEAEEDVRGSLILEKVAGAENIEVSEAEIDDALRELAPPGSGESPASLKTRLTRNGGLARLQSSRRNQKALDFIYHNARVVATVPPVAPLASGELQEQHESQGE